MPRRDPASNLYPNHTSADEMVARFGLDRATADLVVRHRPYRCVEDLLRIPDLLRGLAPRDLFQLLGHAGRTLPASPRLPCAERLTETDQETGTTYGVTVDVDGERRVFLADGAGNEIASADLAAGSVPVDVASFRVVGHHPWELLRLHPLDRARIRDYLAGPACANAGHVWRRLRDQWTRLESHEASAVAWLSQLLAGFMDATRSATRGRRPGSGSHAVVPHLLPDVDWWDGESLGGDAVRDEAGRRAAEDRLFERIRSRGRIHHPAVAALYLVGREALTAIEPNGAAAVVPVAVPASVRYVGSPDRGAGDGAVTAAPAAGRVTVRLLDVSYDGEDIGSDWTYLVTVEDEPVRILSAGTHAHGTQRPWEQVVYDAVRSEWYGTSFPLALSVTAREHDVMWDDLATTTQHLLVQCDPAFPLLTYRTELVAAVRERRWYGAGRRTARLRFTFEVEAGCA